jgi:hypothetical protein
MIRKLVCSMFVMTIGIGLVAAEEFSAQITKVDGDKVTLQKTKKKAEGFGVEKDGDPVTLPVAKDAKITKAKFNFDKDNKKVTWEPDGAVEGGLKNDIFKIEAKKADDTKDKGKGKGKGKGGFGGFGGLNAQITTSSDGKTITAIEVRQFGGFGKKKAATDK